MTNSKKISSKKVEYIAKLARIDLSEAEKERFSRELSDVLLYVEQLQEVDTENIKPMEQASGMLNVMREDNTENIDENSRKRMIRSFPKENNGYIEVRQVLR